MAKTYSAPPPMTIDPSKTYTGTIDTTGGKIEFELDPKEAPLHVNSFVFLSREGFYNGVIFHRVIPGFMIQGGDPDGTGSGGPGYKVKAEVNDGKPVRGVVCAARQSGPNSGGRQVFIMDAASPPLEWQYSAFGKVASGLEIVDK